MIRNATDLTPAEKAAVETLLGRPVQDGEAVSLRTFEQAKLSLQDRLEIADPCLRQMPHDNAPTRRLRTVFTVKWVRWRQFEAGANARQQQQSHPTRKTDSCRQ